VEGIRDHQQPSVAIRDHQWPSRIISGTQWRPLPWRDHQRQSRFISGHQRSSVAIKVHQWHSVETLEISSAAIKVHQWPSRVISGNQESSVALRGDRYLGEVHRQVEVVVGERAVLGGVEHLEQRGGRVGSPISSELLDLVKHEHLMRDAIRGHRQSHRPSFSISSSMSTCNHRGHQEAIKRLSRGHKRPSRGHQWQSSSPGCSCPPGAAPAQSALVTRPHTCADVLGCRPHPTHLMRGNQRSSSEVIIRGHHQRSSSEVIIRGHHQRSSSEVIIRGHHTPPSEMRSNLMRDAIRGHHQRSSHTSKRDALKLAPECTCNRLAE
jgi:hypothetical protein